MSASNASSLDEIDGGALAGDLGAFHADAAAPALSEGESGLCAFNSSHWRAAEATAEALAHGRSIALIVGAPETGLAAAAREASRALDRRFSAIRVSAQGVSGLELAHALAEALGAEPDEDECGDVSALDALRARLEQLATLDVAVVAFIAHADALDEDGLAILGRLAAHGRRLARLRAADSAGADAPLGLKLVLLGRPALVERLAAQKDGAMRQAADGAARLRNFRPDEVRAYLRRRLRPREDVETGAVGPITAEAVDVAARVTGGRPERLGALCAHPALVKAVESGEPVDRERIEQIAADLDFDVVEAELALRPDGGFPEDREPEDPEAVFEDIEETSELEAWASLEGEAERSRRLAEDLSRQLGGANGSAQLSQLARHISQQIEKLAQAAAAKLRRRVADKLARRRPAAKARHRTVTRGAWARRLMMALTAVGVGVGLAVISVLGPRLLESREAAPMVATPPEATVEGGEGGVGSGPVLDIVDSALEAAESAARAVTGDEEGGLAEDVASTRAELARGRALGDIEGLAPKERAAEIERRIRQALETAEARFEARRFTAPEGESAYDALLKAYYLDPADPRVATGLDKLVEHYRAEAQEALAREQFQDFYRLNTLVEQIQRRRPL